MGIVTAAHQAAIFLSLFDLRGSFFGVYCILLYLVGCLGGVGGGRRACSHGVCRYLQKLLPKSCLAACGGAPDCPWALGARPLGPEPLCLSQPGLPKETSPKGEGWVWGLLPWGWRLATACGGELRTSGRGGSPRGCGHTKWPSGKVGAGRGGRQQCWCGREERMDGRSRGRRAQEGGNRGCREWMWGFEDV